MKLILILSFFLSSLSTHATDYICNSRVVKLELNSDRDLSTLIIRDAQTREFIYSGIISELLTTHDETHLIFEVEHGKSLQLRFKTKPLDEAQDLLLGLARGWTGRQFLDHSVRCFKRNQHQ